ncbi:MAG: asparagine synthase (glutamine-hydrolyzing), partial [Nitrospirota bacterium]|nr:asparagine synthase (glutamine-hydrolyzing) [Nitrospirota bacterium]
HQPMSNEDGSIWIVFNGEIYNFLELKDQLEKNGHTFRSHSDTETIIHLYEEEGVECVKRLRGMFAFAIWDEKKQRLLLARDRLGKKPLVYARRSDSLVFASEIKAILQDPSVQAVVDKTALHHFLTYFYVPSPHTAFSGINKLPAGHILIWEKSDIRIERYWDLHYQPKLRLDSEREYCDQFLHTFEDAVRARLISDVPLGAFLSGGIDSSAVVAIMSRIMSQPVKTFSIGFEDEDFSELEFARIVAKRYGTDHHEFVVKPDAVSVLPKLVWHYNEPFADSSAIPTWYVSKITREHVTVALSGDGGDESYAGYQRYKADLFSSWYYRLPKAVREGLLRPLAEKLPYRDSQKSFIRRAKRFITSVESNRQRQYIKFIGAFDNMMKEELYSEAFRTDMASVDSIKLLEHWYGITDATNFTEKTLYADTMSYLPDNILVKVDIAGMGNSLETRAPFLDHHLVEFAASLPPNMKMRGLTQKYILKRAFSDLLPAEILYRKKMGFGVPIERWIRGELKDMVRDALLSDRSIKRGYFNRSYVETLVKDHMSKRKDNCYRIWTLLMLELWHRMFIDGDT